MAARRETGRTLTLLLVFLVTVIAVVVIFGYFTNTLHFGTTTKNVQISGVMSIQSGGGPRATVAFSITNLSNVAVVGISFSCPSSQFADPTCSSLTMNVGGLPVSSQNPVGNKQIAGGYSSVSAPFGGTFTAGQAYAISITFSFADGSSQTTTQLLPAQA